MDFIELPVAELGYRVETIRRDGSYRPDRRDAPRIKQLVKHSKVVYGTGFGIPRFARKFGIPYIPITVCNFRAQLEIVRLSTHSRLRQISRRAKTYVQFACHIKELTHAHSVHCNGYPAYRESLRFNSNSLLFFESRMSADLVISKKSLKRRLAELKEGDWPRASWPNTRRAQKKLVFATTVCRLAAGRLAHMG